MNDPMIYYAGPGPSDVAARAHRPGRRTRAGRSTTLLVAAALAAGCAASGGSTDRAASSPGPVPEPVAPLRASPDGSIDRLLELSNLESVISGRAPTFTRLVALLAADLTDAELERLVPAVSAAFHPDSVRRDVASFIAAEAPAGAVPEVLSWMEHGANGEVARIADAYEAPLTLDEFAASLASDPPDPRRIDVMVEWTRQQGAGDFFVLMDQALEEGAYSVLAVFRPVGLPFAPLRGEALDARLDQSRTAALVTFLYRYETVPDAVIRAATEEFATEMGQWYVQTYALAVAEAIRTAAGRAVTTMGGRTPSPLSEPR